MDVYFFPPVVQGTGSTHILTHVATFSKRGTKKNQKFGCLCGLGEMWISGEWY